MVLDDGDEVAFDWDTMREQAAHHVGGWVEPVLPSRCEEAGVSLLSLRR